MYLRADATESIPVTAIVDDLLIEFLAVAKFSGRSDFVTTGLSISISDARVVSEFPSHVPLPPALYLFGSGLLGLIGIARRKKAA